MRCHTKKHKEWNLQEWSFEQLKVIMWLIMWLIADLSRPRTTANTNVKSARIQNSAILSTSSSKVNKIRMKFNLSEKWSLDAIWVCEYFDGPKWAMAKNAKNFKTVTERQNLLICPKIYCNSSKASLKQWRASPAIHVTSKLNASRLAKKLAYFCENIAVFSFCIFSSPGENSRRPRSVCQVFEFGAPEMHHIRFGRSSFICRVAAQWTQIGQPR